MDSSKPTSTEETTSKLFGAFSRVGTPQTLGHFVRCSIIHALMPRTIKRIEASGLHGRFSLAHSFAPGMNIIYGRNGTGKTTVLHILANILNEDYERFAHLLFSTIFCEFDDGTYTQLERSSSDWDSVIHVTSPAGQTKFTVREALEAERVRDEGGFNPADAKQPRAAYFPAFRTMIEAWSSLEDQPLSLRQRASVRPGRVVSQDLTSTKLARELFGSFVPHLSFPSPSVIENALSSYLEQAFVKLASKDRKLLDQAILDIVHVTVRGVQRPVDELASRDTKDILDEIRTLSGFLNELPFGGQQESESTTWQQLNDLVLTVGKDAPENLSPILDVYVRMLRTRVDEQSAQFLPVESYLESVNSFFEHKRLQVFTGTRRPRRSLIGIRFDDNSSMHGLTTLSSGERQIITLVYATTQMSSQDVVLVDEPEISLHVDWQRTLMPAMQKQLGERQVITTTHSPIIGADYLASRMELMLSPALPYSDDVDLLEDMEGPL